jgi:hypothetical protein
MTLIHVFNGSRLINVMRFANSSVTYEEVIANYPDYVRDLAGKHGIFESFAGVRCTFCVVTQLNELVSIKAYRDNELIGTWIFNKIPTYRQFSDCAGSKLLDTMMNVEKITFTINKNEVNYV